mgnify:CR=1 FL=1
MILEIKPKGMGLLNALSQHIPKNHLSKTGVFRIKLFDNELHFAYNRCVMHISSQFNKQVKKAKKALPRERFVV